MVQGARLVGEVDHVVHPSGVALRHPSLTSSALVAQAGAAVAGGVRVGEGAAAGVLTAAEEAGLELAGAEAELGAVNEVELLAAEAQPAVTATHSSAAAWTPRLVAVDHMTVPFSYGAFRPGAPCPRCSQYGVRRPGRGVLGNGVSEKPGGRRPRRR